MLSARATTAARARTSPSPTALYHNDGDGRFSDVTEKAGISKADGAGLGVSTGDYNGDGWLDLYVANDATPNQLWINRKDGTFARRGSALGHGGQRRGQPRRQHGHRLRRLRRRRRRGPLRHQHHRRNLRALHQRRQGNFDDARTRAGLAAPTAPYTGFGTDWFDYDNDGQLDLFIANGAVNIVEAQRGQPRPFRMKNQLFRNVGGGRFMETTASAGPALARADIARGAAFGDIDNDGDVDVVATNNGGPAKLLLNQSVESGSKNHWLQVSVRQPSGNRFGFGAWIGVERAGQPTLWRRVRTDGSYLSASDARVHFGLGASPRSPPSSSSGPTAIASGGPASRSIATSR